VRLARVAITRPAERPARHPASSGITVEVGAARIAVERTFDTATLAAVLAVVVAAAEARP